MNNSQYGIAFRYIHFSLIVFGLSSYFTGELAEEYEPFGFWIHAILGILLSIAIATRLFYGLFNSGELSFLNWGKKVVNYRRTVFEDLKLLFGLSLPDRNLHDGIAGLVQGFGLLVFCWMSFTGLFLFLIEIHIVNIDDHLFEELHEIGEVLIPAFLLLHVGAVVLHYIKGDNLLIKINPFKKN